MGEETSTNNFGGRKWKHIFDHQGREQKLLRTAVETVIWKKVWQSNEYGVVDNFSMSSTIRVHISAGISYWHLVVKLSVCVFVGYVIAPVAFFVCVQIQKQKWHQHSIIL